MNAVGLAVAVYLLIQFGVGIWASRRISSEDDYLIAGRQLGYPLGVLSIFATWFGAETCIGAAGDIAEHGLSLTTAEPFGYGLCIILMGVIFAAPLWRRKLTTLADLFRQRYSVGVERLAAVFLIPTSLFWAAAQIRAFGHVLSNVTALDVTVAITVAAAVAIAYTVVGGFLADAITDLIQGVALTIGLGILFVALLIHLGGPASAVTIVREIPRATPAPTSLLEALEAWSVPVLGSLIATELVSRVIATRTSTIAVRSAVLAGCLYITVGLIPVFVGLTGATIIPNLAESEQLLPAVAQAILPTALYAIFAGALISAILSTVDSTLLISAGLLSHNVIVPAVPTLTEIGKVRLARGAVMTFGVIAFIIAMNSTSVMDLVEQASAFGSAGTLVVVSFGLFTGFGARWAAVSTLVAGMASYIIGVTLGATTPFILSVAASAVTYLIVGFFEGKTGRHPSLDPT